MPLPTSVADVALVVLPETVGAVSLQPHRGIGDQLKLADRKGIPLAIILGSSELESGTATLKELRSGDQSVVSLEDLGPTVQDLLGRTAAVR
jgi:histidyl-tRNA synthetase